MNLDSDALFALYKIKATPKPQPHPMVSISCGCIGSMIVGLVFALLVEIALRINGI